MMNEEKNSDFNHGVGHEWREEATDLEVGGDFTLPDYQPQIRRILRTDTVLLPAGRFAGEGRWEFGGVAGYTLIYSDADGKLAAANLDADYEYAVKHSSAPSRCWREDTAEGTVCRPQGPRRVTLRTRVAGNTAFTWDAQSPSKDSLLPEGVDKDRVEWLSETSPRMALFVEEGEEIPFSAAVSPEGVSAEDLRVLWSRYYVEVTETAVTDGGVSVKGQIHLSCTVASGEDTLPTVCETVADFATEVPFDEKKEGDRPLAFGFCRGVTVTPTESGEDTMLLFEGECIVTVCLAGNRPYRSYRDVYGIGQKLHVTYKEEKVAELLGAARGTYPITAHLPRGEEAMEATGVLDTAGRIVSRELTFSRGCATVAGEWEAQLILVGAREGEGGAKFIPATVRAPYRIEIPLEGSREADGGRLHLSLCGAVGRIDGESFSVSATLHAELCAYRNGTFTRVDGITAGEREEGKGSIALYYPEEKETLWSVGKKYGVPLAALAKDNNLAHDAVENAGIGKPLDGISALLVLK